MYVKSPNHILDNNLNVSYMFQFVLNTILSKRTNALDRNGRG